MIKEKTNTTLTFEDFKIEVLNDYKLAIISRECSLLGRKEVLTGKAKFGIFGDGKEVPQLAMAKAFKNGDFRSGYYRDQTFMMAIGELTVQQFFAGLYGHTDVEQEPMSAGRQMGGHFATHSLNEDGTWKNLTKQKNSSADISPTAGQMPRLLGLAQASKIYRQVSGIPNAANFSNEGNEIAWGTIGNASTSEGLFFETINAAGVLQVPMVMSVWDDEYGISVHAKHQTTKENISEILKGYQRENGSNGYEILKVKGWDYADLIATYEKAADIARENHIPVLIHVNELTQPQGHSSSGSHERYKDANRLAWERDFDCIRQMKLWMIAINIASPEEIDAIDAQAKKDVLEGKKAAWNAFIEPIIEEQKQLVGLLEKIAETSKNKDRILQFTSDLNSIKSPLKKEILVTARKVLRLILNENGKEELSQWISSYTKTTQEKFSSNLFSETDLNVFSVEKVLPVYPENAKEDTDGRMILRDNFDAIFTKYPETLIFGEDAGNIGDVNQGLEGMQEKYGELRVADVGIREATILGQGIGMALRGLRPIAEIQYLDYLLYAIQIMSDDLATLRYRTVGKQKAPLIIRTRGHRLEGIWHSGSPMGMIINAIRGIHVLVPRNMTQAAGFYNSLLECDEPALVIECLNGYRLKEKMPLNYGEFKTPIGVVETLKEGADITLVSYGSTLRLVQQAANELLEVGIDCEIIDLQSLLPFDINQDVVKSIAKTNRLLVIDEDVPGGASAYILQQIIEQQDAYNYLDSKPQTLTAKAHRPAYGTDGDYFSKPSAEDIFEKVYAMMNEVNPSKYPNLY
ncbi:MAG: thiamine pyrophosphate-dependent enzyme [Flavobacterium sp.]|jgi:pyruvate/2-oxoglutarate/acetoin dehydrogenase E1 component/TPP-dependent pyruvate/acetoin dehydrogenase alpha subunit|uniref:alpha-ketoacid dehydrogenase subunit alpha/beta n=1 Tax=unclassified Flavobacterium TaxID=196869 RepID=UPI000C19BA0F|nr:MULTISPECIES: alpha-ketoacid dehydrogenase subunit alpha/beta [unclassified Flavobacterium]MDP3682216.1 thiamine pyrophosphate-dependent enzyme [Flavobacterium sp.]PIF62749.1 pyruvate/2-oxoglutarate/acetoin dehydrogenase E1 component [Flavobacterium sp. 11]RKS14373.1 pyruvate/2-oxoglutarate/acetoin dehydrogenase E1 component [Flavobacterium sp. 120]WKL44212.1 thiamine pyrophosphate-dependent enzyme [Flavobacterium sp. ZE23DGlu08]